MDKRTVSRMDAAIERTGMYSQRVRVPCLGLSFCWQIVHSLSNSYSARNPVTHKWVGLPFVTKT
jgi:hypothetical protein